LGSGAAGRVILATAGGWNLAASEYGAAADTVRQIKAHLDKT